MFQVRRLRLSVTSVCLPPAYPSSPSWLAGGTSLFDHDKLAVSIFGFLSEFDQEKEKINEEGERPLRGSTWFKRTTTSFGFFSSHTALTQTSLSHLIQLTILKMAVESTNHTEKLLRVCAEISSQLISAHDSGETVSLNQIRTQVCRKHKFGSMPRLIDIIASVPDSHRKVLMPYLRAKPVRSASGIAVVAVMCKPHRCPHIALTGNVCVYCPGVQIQISNTQLNLILVMNLLV